MRNHELFFLALAFVAEILGTLSGFGSSTFFVPIAQLLESLQVVLVITGFLHIASNISKLILFKNINWRILFIFGPATLIPVSLGSWLSDRFPKQIYEIIIGLLLICSCLMFFKINELKLVLQKSRIYQLFAGAISGFLTGLVGTGGAIRGIALATLGLTKESFISTSAAIDLAGDLNRTIFYVSKGYLNPEHYFYLWTVIPIAFVGTWVGRLLVSKISETLFLKVVLISVAAVGLLTLVRGIFEP